MWVKRLICSYSFIAAISVIQSQALCPSRDSNQVQMRAEVIKASDGITFRGVRVFWTFVEDYSSCTSIVTLAVRVRSSGGDHQSLFPDGRDYIDITFGDRSTDFTYLACNYEYQFQITYGYNLHSYSYFFHGTSLFYGGSMRSVPSKILHVFSGPDVLDPEARLSISWDPLPCRLQNGANISEYIIQYRLAHSITNETQSIYASDDRLDCIQQPIGPYKCYLTNTLFLENQTYIFQVAAMNLYGIGPFSDPVNATVYSQGMTDSLMVMANTSSSVIYVPASARSLWLYLTVSLWPRAEVFNSTTNAEYGEGDSESNSTKAKCTCDDIPSTNMSQVVTLVWIIAGSQVIIVIVLVGMMILFMIILKWMRMTLISKGITLHKDTSDASRSGQMQMTDCMAYHVIRSTQRGGSYESTS